MHTQKHSFRLFWVISFDKKPPSSKPIGLSGGGSYQYNVAKKGVKESLDKTSTDYQYDQISEAILQKISVSLKKKDRKEQNYKKDLLVLSDYMTTGEIANHLKEKYVHS